MCRHGPFSPPPVPGDLVLQHAEPFQIVYDVEKEGDGEIVYDDEEEEDGDEEEEDDDFDQQRKDLEMMDAIQKAGGAAAEGKNNMTKLLADKGIDTTLALIELVEKLKGRDGFRTKLDTIVAEMKRLALRWGGQISFDQLDSVLGGKSAGLLLDKILEADGCPPIEERAFPF